MADDRPSDEDILAWGQSVQDDATSNTPLVTSRAPIASLKSEYERGNPIILEKIGALGDVGLYRTRGDGNCFYRAFAFALFMHALHSQCARQGTLDRIQASRQVLEAGAFSELVYEDFLMTTEGVVKDSRDEGAVLTAMNDMEISNSVVVYLRFLTSAYVKSHRDLYAAYLETGQVVERWCERWIEAIGAEADNIQINALVNALCVGVDVVTLDASASSAGTDASNKANVLQVRQDEGHAEIVVKVLYRPGHYDVLL